MKKEGSVFIERINFAIIKEIFLLMKIVIFAHKFGELDCVIYK